MLGGLCARATPLRAYALAIALLAVPIRAMPCYVLTCVARIRTVFADVWANQKGVLRTLCVGIDIGG